MICASSITPSFLPFSSVWLKMRPLTADVKLSIENAKLCCAFLFSLATFDSRRACLSFYLNDHCHGSHLCSSSSLSHAAVPISATRTSIKGQPPALRLDPPLLYLSRFASSNGADLYCEHAPLDAKLEQLTTLAIVWPITHPTTHSSTHTVSPTPRPQGWPIFIWPA